jgi:hypothetical protein
MSLVEVHSVAYESRQAVRIPFSTRSIEGRFLTTEVYIYIHFSVSDGNLPSMTRS